MRQVELKIRLASREGDETTKRRSEVETGERREEQAIQGCEQKCPDKIKVDIYA